MTPYAVTNTVSKESFLSISRDIVVEGLQAPIKPDADGNFLFPEDSDARDAVNALAIADLVLTMYRRALKRAGFQGELNWAWGTDPLRIFPKAGEHSLAAYSRLNKALAFCYFHNRWNNEMVYTVRSFDIVAHEAGHAVLDMLHSAYHRSPAKDPQTPALGEAFADLTAIFAFLSQLDNVDTILAASKGDLHAPNFLREFGEQYGLATTTSRCVRDLDEYLALDQVTEDSHDLSCVFTGAVYDVLVSMFQANVDLSREDPAETLYKAAMSLSEIVIMTFAAIRDEVVTFYMVAQKMMELAPEESIRGMMRKQFSDRKILDPNVKPKPKPKEGEAKEGEAPSIPTPSACGTGKPIAEEVTTKKASGEEWLSEKNNRKRKHARCTVI